MKAELRKTEYEGFTNCLLLTNGEIEVVISSEFGPRILFYGYKGEENILGLHPQAEVESELGIWKPYGGHRLWIAPENFPNSYAPDNSPVESFFDEKNNSLRLVQKTETVSETQKELTVKIDETGSGLTIDHKIRNLGEREIEIAAWALTIMRSGGEVFLPNEDFTPYDTQNLLPVRNLAVWSYTDFSDSRWKFERDFIRLKVDENNVQPQKIGALNTKGWIKYKIAGLEFTKFFAFEKDAKYPDLNCNSEIYTAGNFVETESLSSLKKLKTGESVEHREVWNLKKV